MVKSVLNFAMVAGKPPLEIRKQMHVAVLTKASSGPDLIHDLQAIVCIPLLKRKIKQGQGLGRAIERRNAIFT